MAPSPIRTLPPQAIREARPKAISGRTSYRRVRLAFHPYPQLIRWFFNTNRFGPPRGLTRASPWPWVAHPVSGLQPVTVALFRLGFPAAPDRKPLTSPQTATRRLMLQKARRQAMSKDIPLRLIVGTRFQVLFHSPPGVLFTFPSRYWSTIGRFEYLALEGGPPSFPQGFPCPVVLGMTAQADKPPFAYGAVTLCGRPFQARSTRRLTKPGEFTASPGRLPQPHAGNACELDTGMVWALPRSLATTKGISVDFFSSRY